MSQRSQDLYEQIQQRLGRLEKDAFTPMPPPAPQGGGGAMPPMDPAMAAMGGGGGAMPPMDPAMMAAMGGGGAMPPMDPAMMAAMGGGPMPPEPAAGPGVDPESIKQIIRDELTEAGVIKKEKMSPDDSMQWLHQKLDTLFQHLGVPVPKEPGSEEAAGEGKPKSQESGDSGSSEAVMGPGTTGQGSSLPAGSLDQQPMISGAPAPPPAPGGGQKAASADDPIAFQVRDAIKRLRG